MTEPPLRPTSKTSLPRIKIVENGPYLVTGGVPLFGATIVINENNESVRWQFGERIAARETYSLCRCGRTLTPPFCDGAHARFSFDGRVTADRRPYLVQARRLTGPGLGLTDAEPLCASARFCLRAGGIWNLIRRSQHDDARKAAIQEAWDCPSGRLVAWEPGGAALEPEFEPGIAVVKDPLAQNKGPLWVRGGVPVESAEGFVYESRNRVTLCRCGRSQNKPFCDGDSHGMAPVD